MQPPEPRDWRPIQPGEDIREYHDRVEYPVKFWGMVDYVVSLPSNRARNAFCEKLGDRQSAEFVKCIRQAARERLQGAA